MIQQTIGVQLVRAASKQNEALFDRIYIPEVVLLLQSANADASGRSKKQRAITRNTLRLWISGLSYLRIC